MKNTPIDPYAAKDILEQVQKVLRGIGNPEPPIDLRDVRELLKLDLQFYSSSDTSALREFISKVKIGARQLALRPSLILDVVREAGLKALWIPDRKRILIDDSIPQIKKRHAEAHEITHSITAHHAPFLFGDDRETLRSSCHEKLEAEANFGAAQLLFPQERFLSEARELPRTIDSVRTLAKTFGNTITMALWRFVEEARSDEALFGLISCHPRRIGADFNPQAPCRYFIESPAFRERFGNVTAVEAFEAVRGYASRASGGSLGESTTEFSGRDGRRHVFRMETFFNRHEALTLGSHVAAVATRVFVS